MLSTASISSKLSNQTFDIKITDKEAEGIYSVGEMCDLLLHKIAADHANRKCASAMAFYRLRRAISELRVSEKLTPSTPLGFLERGRTKSNFRSLEKQTGLRLPQPAMTWIGSIGALAALFPILAILPLYILSDQNVMPEKWLVSLPSYLSPALSPCALIPVDCRRIANRFPVSRRRPPN